MTGYLKTVQAAIKIDTSQEILKRVFIHSFHNSTINKTFIMLCNMFKLINSNIISGYK